MMLRQSREQSFFAFASFLCSLFLIACKLLCTEHKSAYADDLPGNKGGSKRHYLLEHRAGMHLMPKKCQPAAEKENFKSRQYQQNWRNEEIAKNEWKSFGWGLSVIQ